MHKLEILLTGSLGVLSINLVEGFGIIDMILKLGVSGVTLYLLVKRSRTEDEENKFKNKN